MTFDITNLSNDGIIKFIHYLFFCGLTISKKDPKYKKIIVIILLIIFSPIVLAWMFIAAWICLIIWTGLIIVFFIRECIDCVQYEEDNETPNIPTYSVPV